MYWLTLCHDLDRRQWQTNLNNLFSWLSKAGVYKFIDILKGHGLGDYDFFWLKGLYMDGKLYLFIKRHLLVILYIRLRQQFYR